MNGNWSAAVYKYYCKYNSGSSIPKRKYMDGRPCFSCALYRVMDVLGSWESDFFRALQTSSVTRYSASSIIRTSIIRTSIIRTPHLVASRAQFNPFLRRYKLTRFSFHRVLNFVDKFCCDYHEYQTQKVNFFSAVVFS